MFPLWGDKQFCLEKHGQKSVSRTRNKMIDLENDSKKQDTNFTGNCMNAQTRTKIS